MITNIVAYLLLGGSLALVGLIAAVIYDMRRANAAAREYIDSSNDAPPAPVTAPKKRGRPKGSKTKTKTKKAIRSRA
jgi:hypothetical protein